MTNHPLELSRQKRLGNLGVVGAVGAGPGLGTTALFSDIETIKEAPIVPSELRAGQVSMANGRLIDQPDDDDRSNGADFEVVRSRRELLGLSILRPGTIDAETWQNKGTGLFHRRGHALSSLFWWIPVALDNESQSDPVAFDLGFHTEQSHNDGARLTPETNMTNESAS